MPVLLESDKASAEAHAALLPDGADIVETTEALEKRLQSRPDEYAVVVGPGTSLREAGMIAEKLRETHPSAGVVLIRRDVDTQVYQDAMRLGIPAVVSEGDALSLGEAIGRIRTTWEAIHGPLNGVANGRVITVFSPKGGTGKTTVSVNLAACLARDPKVRVCIVDLDLAFGDVAITLQLIPEHTIEEAVGSESSLDYALLQKLLTRYSDNISVLAAPTSPDAKERIKPELVGRTLATLRKHFEYIIVDTAPGFDDQVLQAFDATDELIVLATLDVPTVKNTKMAMETLDLLDIVKENRRLVLNRADDEVGLTPQNVESILRLPVSVAIPSDTAVAIATNHGRPLTISQPDHRVSREIAALAAITTNGAADITNTKRGLFGRSKRAGGNR